MEVPSVRDAYGAVEKRLAPRLESLVRTEQFNEVAALVTGTRSMLTRRLNSISARLLHAVNLPAGTDVARLRRQIGELDREVRMLRRKLESSESASPEPAAPHPAASSTTPAKPAARTTAAKSTSPHASRPPRGKGVASDGEPVQPVKRTRPRKA